MISKTLLGIEFFDEHFGGVYKGRAVLISGRQGVGKSMAALCFLRQGLQMDERCMLLSTMPSNDFAIYSNAMGFDFSSDLNDENLVLLEYSNFVPAHGFGEGAMLPPDGFDQLRAIIDNNLIHRVVLDTVLPWVSLPSSERLQEHVFSFVRFLDRLNVTTMMTIPKPASPMALRLKKALEDTVPISCVLAPDDSDAQDVFVWQTVKYFGERKLAPPIKYMVSPGAGIRRAQSVVTTRHNSQSFLKTTQAWNGCPNQSDTTSPALKDAYANAGWTYQENSDMPGAGLPQPQSAAVTSTNHTPIPPPLPAVSPLAHTPGQPGTPNNAADTAPAKNSLRFSSVWTPSVVTSPVENKKSDKT